MQASFFRLSGFRPGISIRLEFRAGMFNFTNSVTFAPPGQALGNAQFGVVSSQQNSPRRIQFGLKLYS